MSSLLMLFVFGCEAFFYRSQCMIQAPFRLIDASIVCVGVWCGVMITVLCVCVCVCVCGERVCFCVWRGRGVLECGGVMCVVVVCVCVCVYGERVCLCV